MKTLLISSVVAFVLLVVPCRSQDLVLEIDRGINAIRSSHGLSRLSRESRLDSAARSQADWMLSVGRMDHLRNPASSLDEYRVCNWHPINRVVNSGYFSFDEVFSVEYNPNGATVHPRPMANTHINEIIAAARGGGPEVRSPGVILNGWMNSPGHRKVILTPHYKEFGVGISGRGGDVYWCVVFATREL